MRRRPAARRTAQEHLAHPAGPQPPQETVGPDPRRIPGQQSLHLNPLRECARACAWRVPQSPPALGDRLGAQGETRGGRGSAGNGFRVYEPDAVLAFPRGKLTAGRDAIREEYRQFLADQPALDGDSQPTLRLGDLALTSTRFTGGVTAEVARRQPDGTWLWVIDQPSVLG
jgi:hypothetical protein